MRKLINQVKQWALRKLDSLKRWAYAFSKTQAYVVLVFVTLLVCGETYYGHPWISLLSALWLFVLVGWWVLVAFDFIKNTDTNDTNV